MGPRRARVESREEALEVVWSWLDGLDGRMDWSGQGGGTRRAVAEALGLWALERGGFRFTASLDEIAIEAGVHRHSARCALRALVDAGIVARIEAPGGRTASRWQLLEAGGGGGEDRAAFGGLGADWARFGAVGKRGAMAWRRCVGGAIVAEVAESLGVGESTARHHLRRLVHLRVVELVDGRYHALDPAGTAVLFGTDGAQQHQRDALVRQRRLRAGGRGSVRGSA